MDIQSEIFARNLKARRRELGLTQKKLAELIEYSEKSVSKWESGYAIAKNFTILELTAAERRLKLLFQMPRVL